MCYLNVGCTSRLRMIKSTIFLDGLMICNATVLSVSLQLCSFLPWKCNERRFVPEFKVDSHCLKACVATCDTVIHYMFSMSTIENYHWTWKYVVSWLDSLKIPNCTTKFLNLILLLTKSIGAMMWVKFTTYLPLTTLFLICYQMKVKNALFIENNPSYFWLQNKVVLAQTTHLSWE